MPELPEVETIRQKLRKGSDNAPSLIGMQISGALISWERSLAEPTPQAFFARLPGQTVNEIGRRGKYFVFHLSEDYLLVHLRMSGDLVMETQDAPYDPYARMAIFLNDGWRLAFNDSRKFGRMWLVQDPDRILGALGPEPFDPKLSAEIFYERLHQRQRQLKPLLLDQRFLAGVGNIYADEALYLAGLHPLVVAAELDKSQANTLLDKLRKALQEGIDHSGASIDWIYRGGEHQQHFRVYQRTGKPCLKCETPIERIVVGQRGSHFCPACQVYKKGI